MVNNNTHYQAVSSLKRAIRSKDVKLIKQAVDALESVGYKYQDIYRVALAGDPDLSLGEWDDLMSEIDDLNSRD